VSQAKVPVGRGQTILAEIMPNKTYYASPDVLLADRERNLWVSKYSKVAESGAADAAILLGRDSKGALHVWPLPGQSFFLDPKSMCNSCMPVNEVHFESKPARVWHALAVLQDRS
jgi:hypothetical protein